MAAAPSPADAAGTPQPLRVLIAGGGTGGHFFPGLAIAEALQAQHPGTDVRFAGSPFGIEARAVPAQGYRLYRIPVRGLYAVPWRQRLWVLAMLPVALLRCLWALLTFRPHLVIGVGGYASGPMLAAAVLLRRLVVIQEQNAWPGLTNRLLGRWVHTGFVPVAGLERFFRRTQVLGTPVRRAILALRDEAPAAPGPQDPPGLLVIGGSQGARVINRAMVAALPLLKARGLHPRIVHQSGAADLAEVRAGYAQAGVAAEVLPFIEDMAGAYRACRLIVSRAGASAVSEIVAARRAAVLVPIPGTSGDHQLRNAQRLAQAGAAVLLEQKDLTGEALAALLADLLADPGRLDGMAAACDPLYQGDAAAHIASACLTLVRAHRRGAV